MTDSLHGFIWSLPSDVKRELINSFNGNYKEGRGNVYTNTRTIYNYLLRNDFGGEVSLEHIREFINDSMNPKPQYEEYFEERMPDIDESEEIKQLEEARDEINKRIEELKQQQEQQQQQLNNTHTNESMESNDTNNTNELNDAEPSDKVKSIMKSLYDKPFETDIPLIALSINECTSIAPLLKEWYENVIKNNELNSKIGIEFTVNGHVFLWPLNNERVLQKLDNMFNGQFTYSVDEIPASISDGETQINISWMDNIRFVMISEYKKKQGERTNKASAFFEYRLKHEYNEFENILKRYQIFMHLDNDKHNKCREELKYNCLIYALKQHINIKAIDENDDKAKALNEFLNQDMLAKMSNYFMNISHIPTNMLNEFCKSFNINIVLYAYNDKGRLRKMNDKNGGKFGGEKPMFKFNICTFKNHYFIYEEVPISKYYLNNIDDINKYAKAHNWDNCKQWLVVKKRNNRYETDVKKAHMTSLEFVKQLYDINAFQPLYRNDKDVDISGVFHYVRNKQDIQSLEYSEKTNTKRITEKNNKQEDIIKNVFYADFETCYNHELNQEIEFMICVQNEEGTDKQTFIGKHCGKQLLEYLPNNSIVYFHNLGFDGRLLMKYGVRSNIIKGSRIIQQTNYYKGKTITLKDSYSMFTQKLANFPKCFPEEFKNLNIQKELFPYRYYTYERVLMYNNNEKHNIIKPIGIIADCGNDELPIWTHEQKEQFNKNIDIAQARIDNDKFDMLKYCEFYCQQDVNVLRVGFNAFRKAALKDPINLDIFNYLTAPALAQAYLNREVFLPNNNLYMLSGHVRDFVMKAIYGGRCMTKQNKRWRITDKLDDFDACSLYPSAMARLFTIEGTPKVLTNDMFNKDYLINHSFTEDQTIPTKDRFISYYIVEIEITKVGINRDFPLIVERTKTNNMNVNKSVKMVVDMIELEYKIKYQQIEFNILKGYYWDGNRDHRIRDTIKKLFQLRAEYKKQGNSIQQVIKLIMNSGYGKSIQKPIDNELKYVDESKIDHYLYEHWHNIQECRKIPESKQYLIKLNKTIDKQFNNCVFGVSVLSMSKRLMNEVMTLAEDLNINIYYQDTDSMRIEHDKIELFAQEYKRIHNRELIGEDTIGRFHNDFDELKDAYTTLHISLGKKMYYDELTNSNNEHAEHFRMKGIPNNVIINHANKYFDGSVKALYEYLYKGNEITFNLNSTNIRFVMEKTGEIKHKHKFMRKVKATSPL